ncbi:unnamed protein product [Meganyctiphanes norvegica]|uniref:ETS domain-containing protein n=1 Tax=Meganyctiphanes norvegica TaxID=48144 RepID=A0AAV2S242_MEGNR
MAYSQTQRTPQFWSGGECRSWAVSVCEKHYFSQFDINLNALEELSGHQLLSCTQQDLIHFVGHQYAQLFYKELQTLKTTNEQGALDVSSSSFLSHNNSAFANMSGATLDETYGFNSSSGTSSYQSTYNPKFQPNMLSSKPSNTTSYILPGLRTTAQMQQTDTTHESYTDQEPYNIMFSQEQLEDLKTIDETIVEELSKYLQNSSLSDFTSGYSDSNSSIYPSENSCFIETNYSLSESSNVPDMFSNSLSTSNTQSLSKDQSLFDATGFLYDTSDQSYGSGFDDGFIRKKESYNTDQYDYSLFQDVKPNLAEQDESYMVPDINVAKTQDQHNCLYDSIQNPNRKSRKRGPKVWEFVLRCLLDSRCNPFLLCWENMSTGTFRIVQPEQLAKLWGARTGKPDLSYENFSRSLRYHYKQGMLEGLPDRQLVYRFTAQALSAFTGNKNIHN